MRSRLEARAPRSLPLTALSLAAVLAACGCGTSSGSGSGSSPGSVDVSADGSAAVPIPCATASAASTLHLTVSGFVTCTCFNGTFTLTKAADSEDQPPVWSSPAITGCPGQETTAYLKLSDSLSDSYDSTLNAYVVHSELGVGITDDSSEPGSGNSDFAPATDVTCSPFAVSGGGSEAGNIDSFCPGTEDENMKWSVTD